MHLCVCVCVYKSTQRCGKRALKTWCHHDARFWAAPPLTDLPPFSLFIQLTLTNTYFPSHQLSIYSILSAENAYCVQAMNVTACTLLCNTGGLWTIILLSSKKVMGTEGMRRLYGNITKINVCEFLRSYESHGMGDKVLCWRNCDQ